MKTGSVRHHQADRFFVVIFLKTSYEEGTTIISYHAKGRGAAETGASSNEITQIKEELSHCYGYWREIFSRDLHAFVLPFGNKKALKTTRNKSCPQEISRALERKRGKHPFL